MQSIKEWKQTVCHGFIRELLFSGSQWFQRLWSVKAVSNHWVGVSLKFLKNLKLFKQEISKWDWKSNVRYY